MGDRTNYQSVLDIDFDGDTLGSPPPTTSPFGSPPNPFPATNLYATVESAGFGSDDFANSNGVKTTVGNAAGLTKAVIQSNNFAFLASTYLDTQFIPARAERGALAFDFAILQTPTDPNQQVVPGAPGGQDFVINTFSDSSARIWRFFTSHTSPTGGDIFMRNPGVTGAGTNIGTYTVGVPIHVDISADYVHDTVNVALDGITVLANHPFTATRTSTNDQTTEFFIFNNGISGQLTATAIDNIFYVVLPEPSSALLIAASLGGLLVALRRFRR